jgi:integrase
VRDYKGTAKVILLPGFGKDTPLAEITYRDVDAFRSKLLREGHYSKRTIQKALVLLGGIFKTAQRLHGFPSNPAALVRKGTIPRGEVLYFTHEQVESIAQHAEPQDADLFTVMSRIGLRRGEMVALRWQDVDLGRQQVHVRRNYVEGVETSPKDHEKRAVPLPPSTGEVLLRVAITSDYRDPDDLVFPREDGSHLSPDNLSKRFTEAKNAAKLDHPGSLENLRHTFATYAGDAFPLPKVQKWLGHSDPKTTMRYVGVLESADDAAALDAHAAKVAV